MEQQFFGVEDHIAKITNTKAKDWEFDEQQLIEDAVARDVDPYYNPNFDGAVQVWKIKGGVNIYVMDNETGDYSDTFVKGKF